MRLLLALVLAACTPSKDTLYIGEDTGSSGGNPEGCESTDNDVDGDCFDASEDCDDADASVFPGAEEQCDGVDHDCDGRILSGWEDDADGDGVSNCADDTVYSWGFDEWGEWEVVDFGGNNAPRWSLEDGAMMEASDTANTVVLSPDLGARDSFEVTVDVKNSDRRNNAAGLLFGAEGEGVWYMVYWEDPSNHYGTGSSVHLLRLGGGQSDENFGRNDESISVVQDEPRWITLGARVEGSEITVSWDGQEIIQATVPEETPIGINRVGIYSYDNDAGIWYDNVVVTGI
jgi:hypothetical protein